MAVTTIHGPRATPGKFDLSGAREYLLTYRVETNDANDSSITVALAPGIPQIGDTYVCGDDFDLRAYCVHVDCDRISTEDGFEQTKWEVAAQFRTLPREEQKRLVHPLNRPYEISYGFEHFQSVVERDIDGDAILNSAGQYFDPPIERDDSRPVLTVVRNEATFPVLLMIAYQDAINSDVFLNCPVKTVKVFNIAGQRVIEEFGPPNSAVEVVFWRVTYEFHFNRHTWVRQVLDQGRYERITQQDGVTYLEQIKDVHDAHVTDPVPLDGTGLELDDPTPANAVFLPFNIYKELPFAAFSFT